MNAFIRNLHWQSDWNGDEVGYPDVPAVGLCTSHTLGCDFYIDAESGVVLEIMPRCDE